MTQADSTRHGFTLIELLIVIALLGAFAVGILAAVDPFEQLKKGIDSSRLNIATSIYNASINAYASRGTLPISEPIAGTNMSDPVADTYLKTLIQEGELKSSFIENAAGNLSRIFLSAQRDGKTLTVCFLPESKTYKSNIATIYDASGGRCQAQPCYLCMGENENIALAPRDDQPGSPPVGSQTTPTRTPTPTPTSAVPPTPTSTPTINEASDTPITRNVLVIDFNPLLETRGNRRLRDYMGWSNPVALENQYIQDIQTASGGYLTYHIVTRIADIDAYPTKNNGYVFTDDSYLAAQGNPDANARAIINYQKILSDYDVCGKVNAGQIDELWLWGGPWMGYWEAVMAGPNAYNTNAPPIAGTGCTKPLHIMGFSYERGIPELLEDFSHRVEGTMSHFFNGWFFGYGTDWDKYTKGRGFHATSGTYAYGCGNVHFPFNGLSDYDWSNTTAVSTTCAGWQDYPPAPTATQALSCTAWGCTGYGYIKWWLTHLPKAPGKTNGMWNNWWKYIAGAN